MSPRKKTGTAETGDRRNAVIGAVGVVAAAVIAAVVAIITREPEPPECAHEVVIEQPKNGQQVDGSVGVDVTGKVCGLDDGETLWVFEYDPFDRKFYLVYDPDIGRRPVASRNGGFAIHDGPIGDAGDKRKPYEIIAVLGGAECRQGIEGKPVDEDGNYVFTALPDGCRDVARVQILESQHDGPQ